MEFFHLFDDRTDKFDMDAKQIKPVLSLSLLKPEDVSKIFSHVFERSDEAKKLYATGKGIGLAVVKSVIEAHGGTVRAESEGEGKGSRFTVELPL